MVQSGGYMSCVFVCVPSEPESALSKPCCSAESPRESKKELRPNLSAFS